MSHPTQAKGRMLLSLGILAASAATICLRFKLDFLSGLGVGIAIPTIGFGAFTLRRG